MTSTAESRRTGRPVPPASAEARARQRRGLTVFLLIAFGGAWAWIALAYALGLSLVNMLVQLPFAFTPAIGALVVRRWVTREGFADAGLAPRLTGAWRSYLVAWLTPLALVPAAVGTAAVLGLGTADLSALDEVVPGLPGWAGVLALMAVVPLLTPLYWGEEFGWTSYLRPRLCGGRPVPSVLATGLVWAVWHYPLAFTGYIEFDDTLVGLFGYTVMFVCQEILLAALYLRSGTIWTASLAHAGNNMVLFLLLGVVFDADGGGMDPAAVTLVATVPTAALGLAILCGRGLDRR